MVTKKNKTAIPQEYEWDSIESKFNNTIPATYEDGWNDQGTPANFEFNDGVLLEYDEVFFDDVDDFVSQYEELTGYRSYGSKSAEELYELDDEGGLYFYTYTLDFSGHPNLKNKGGNLSVVIKELIEGGNDSIAGIVVISKDLDKKWLLEWINNVSDNNLMVERV